MWARIREQSLAATTVAVNNIENFVVAVAAVDFFLLLLYFEMAQLQLGNTICLYLCLYVRHCVVVFVLFLFIFFIIHFDRTLFSFSIVVLTQNGFFCTILIPF